MRFFKSFLLAFTNLAIVPAPEVDSHPAETRLGKWIRSKLKVGSLDGRITSPVVETSIPRLYSWGLSSIFSSLPLHSQYLSAIRTREDEKKRLIGSEQPDPEGSLRDSNSRTSNQVGLIKANSIETEISTGGISFYPTLKRGKAVSTDVPTADSGNSNGGAEAEYMSGLRRRRHDLDLFASVSHQGISTQSEDLRHVGLVEKGVQTEAYEEKDIREAQTEVGGVGETIERLGCFSWTPGRSIYECPYSIKRWREVLEQGYTIGADPFSHGGFGHIFPAIPRGLGELKKSVIKVMAPDPDNPDKKERSGRYGIYDTHMSRVRNEVDLAFEISGLHPSLLTSYEAFLFQDGGCLVSEHLNGGDLESFMKRAGGKLSEEMTAGIALQVAQALQAMHLRRITHNDVKLNNVMLESTPDFTRSPSEIPQVKVIDVGLGMREADMDTPTPWKGVGRKEFNIPCQMTSKRPCYLPGLQDSYALSVLIFKMLVGVKQVPEFVHGKWVPTRTLSPVVQDLLARQLNKRRPPMLGMEQVLAHPFLTRHGFSPPTFAYLDQDSEVSDGGSMTSGSSMGLGSDLMRGGKVEQQWVPPLLRREPRTEPIRTREA